MILSHEYLFSQIKHQGRRTEQDMFDFSDATWLYIWKILHDLFPPRWSFNLCFRLWTASLCCFFTCALFPLLPLLIVQEVLSNRDLSKCLPLSFSRVPVTPVVLSTCLSTLLIFFTLVKQALQSKFSPFLSFPKQSGLFFILSNKTWCITIDGICLQAKITMKATMLPRSIKGNVQSKASGFSSAKLNEK